jgi:acyl carrier protein
MTVTHTEAVFFPLSLQPASSNSMNANVQQRVVNVIADVLNRNESEIRLDATLHDDLQASSLDQMTLFIALEDEFQRTIPQEEASELKTVKDIVDFIDKKLQDPSPT